MRYCVFFILLSGCSTLDLREPVVLNNTVTFTSTVRSIPVGTLQPRKHFSINQRGQNNEINSIR